MNVEGTDNLSGVTITQLGSVFTITDEAGHTTVLTFKKLNKHGNEIKAKLKSIQYDSALPIRLRDTELKYEWSLNKKDGTIKELEQRIESGRDFDVRAHYSSRKGTTEIATDEKKRTKIIVDGLVVVKLNTDNGNINYSY